MFLLSQYSADVMGTMMNAIPQYGGSTSLHLPPTYLYIVV
jgi:hypothetical protein